MSAAATAPLPPGVTPETVYEEIQRFEARDTSFGQGLSQLGFTLLIFFLAGVFDNPLIDLGVLIGALLFHESGHFFGMKVFGYRDVKMFFIPFFGAAVSGRKTDTAGWKEAVVTLLGPVPGVLLGCGLGTLWMLEPSPFLGKCALMLLLLNGLNLLPLYPLDGGRFLNQVLFSRSRHIEAFCRIGMGGGMVLIGWGDWILSALGIFVVLSTPYVFRVASTAVALRPLAEPGPIPRGKVDAVLAAVAIRFRGLRTPRDYAGVVRTVWEKSCARPPGGLATAGLLLLWGAALGVIVAAFVAYALVGIRGWTSAIQATDAAMNSGRYAEAERSARNAEELATRYRLGPQRRAESLSGIALALALQERHAESEPVWREALELRERALGKQDPLVAATLDRLAMALRKLGRDAEAGTLEERAQGIRAGGGAEEGK